MRLNTSGALRLLSFVLTAAALGFLAVAPPAAAAGMTQKKKPKPEVMEKMPPMPDDIPLPTAAAFNWAGYYAGGFVGGAHGLWTVDFFRNNNHGHAEEGEDGFEGGGWVGYNTYISRNIVAGAEADLGLTSAQQSNNIFDNDTSYAKFNGFGSIRARLGYAMDRWLVFGTAGIAVANITNDIQKGVNAGEQIVWDGQTRVGYAVGAGAEYALTDRWIGRAEYLYENFGTVTQFNADGNRAQMNNQLHQLRVGVSYKF